MKNLPFGGTDMFTFAPKNPLRPGVPLLNSLGERFTIINNVSKWPAVEEPSAVFAWQWAVRERKEILYGNLLMLCHFSLSTPTLILQL